MICFAYFVGCNFLEFLETQHENMPIARVFLLFFVFFVCWSIGFDRILHICLNNLQRFENVRLEIQINWVKCNHFFVVATTKNDWTTFDGSVLFFLFFALEF